MAELAAPMDAIMQGVAAAGFAGPLLRPAADDPDIKQTTWAVGYYAGYGVWTSTIGALAAWGIVAGLT